MASAIGLYAIFIGVGLLAGAVINFSLGYKFYDKGGLLGGLLVGLLMAIL
jgi:hypothetical protein